MREYGRWPAGGKDSHKGEKNGKKKNYCRQLEDEYDTF